MTSVKQLVSFTGRTRRLPFALTGIAIIGLWQLPSPVLMILLFYRVPVHAASYSAVLLLLACLAWPLAASAARRLHDAGLSGWPGAVYLLQFVLALFTASSNAFRGSYAEPWLYASAFWLLVLTTAVLAVLPGNKGENRFGADPRRGSQKAADSF